MLNFFLKMILSPKQLGFRSGDSCIDQLLSINHENLSAFDIGLEIQGLFLNIPKAFDKVWYAALIYKLRQNDICEDLINILTDLLIKIKQRVVLSGQCSCWDDIGAGVLQGSVLLFLIYINDLTDGIKRECKLIGGDTSFFRSS